MKDIENFKNKINIESKMNIKNRYRDIKKINLFKYLIFLTFIIFILSISLNLDIYSLEGKLNNENVNFRNTPDTKKNNIISSFKKGEKVEIISKDGSWYKVKNNKGIEGFVFADYIDEISQEEIEIEKENKAKEDSKNIDDNANKKENLKGNEKLNKDIEKEKIKLKKDVFLQTRPLYYAKKIAEIKAEESIEKIDEIGIWMKVKTEKGEIGWILSSEVS